MRPSIVNKLLDYARADKKVFVVTGDAGYGILDEYQKRFPRRFLNLGVAEQNAAGFSAGLALSGYKVFVYNIIPFLLYRCYEQVRDDICYQDLPVTLIGIGSGLTYALHGMTHYSVEDVALARTLPNLALLSPADPEEARACLEYAYKSKGPVYIRIAKSGEERLHKTRLRSIKSPLVLRQGGGVAVLFHGSIGSEVLKAAGLTKFKPRLISVPLLRPLDVDSLKASLAGIHTVITVEEHFVEGGLGSMIAEWIVAAGLRFRLRKLGIRNEFIHAIQDNPGLRRLYGISAPQIAGVIAESFKSAAAAKGKSCRT